MRLGRMRELLDRSVPMLGLDTVVQNAPSNIGGNAAQMLTGLKGRQLRAALNDLAQIPGVREQASELLGRQPVSDAGDDEAPLATLGSREIPNLKASIDQLFVRAQALREALTEVAPPADEDRLYVRAPDDVNDLGGLEAFIEELKVAIEMPIRLLTGEHVAFRDVERGSVWLVLGLTATVFQATKALIAICDKYCAKQGEKEKAEALFDELNAFNQQLKQAAEDGLRLYGLNLAKELDEAFVDVHPSDHAADVPQKLLHSVERLASLYHRGVQLQLSAKKKVEATDAEDDDAVKQLSAAVVKLLGDGNDKAGK